MDAERKRVAIINSDPQILRLLSEVLEDEGFQALPIEVRQLHNRKVDLQRFINEGNPDAIIFDIGFPYEKSWDFFKSTKPIMEGRNFLLTTTNEKLVSELIKKEDPELHILSKPLEDVFGITKALKEEMNQEIHVQREKE